MGLFADTIPPNAPCNIKLAAIILGISLAELRQLLKECNIKPLDKDHITMRTLDRLRRKVEKIPKIAEGSWITIAEAAEILGESKVTVSKWILRFGMVPFRQVKEGKVKWRVKKKDIETEKQENPFFQQPRYSFPSISKMFKEEGILVCATTLRRWGGQGLINIEHSPAGKPYIMEDQISKCRKLAAKAKRGHQYHHRAP